MDIHRGIGKNTEFVFMPSRTGIHSGMLCVLKLGSTIPTCASFMSPLSPSPPHSIFLPLPFLLPFPMSDTETQLLDAIHDQLNHSVSYNLYTGIAYGTSPPRLTRLLIPFWLSRPHAH